MEFSEKSGSVISGKMPFRLDVAFFVVDFVVLAWLCQLICVIFYSAVVVFLILC